MVPLYQSFLSGLLIGLGGKMTGSLGVYSLLKSLESKAITGYLESSNCTFFHPITK